MRSVSRPLLRSAFLAALAAVVAGCAGAPRPQSYAAVDTPPAFVVLDGGSTRPARAGEGCRNPLVDPRDGTRLTLVRSAEGEGDYEAPAGRYGLRPGHLLRVDCASGRVVGVVGRGR